MMVEAEKTDFAEVPDRCPFCGSEGATLMDLTDGTGMAWVKCLGCRAEGPKRESGVEAVEAWNEVATAALSRRTLPAMVGLDDPVPDFAKMQAGYAPNAAEPADMESVRQQFDELEAKLATYFATAEAGLIEAKKAGWNEAVTNIVNTIRAAHVEGEGAALIERLASAIEELRL